MPETERLLLRRFETGDLEAIYRMRSDAETMRFIREPQDRRESASWLKMISGLWDSDGIGFFAVVEKASRRVVGWCGLWRLKETGETEIGYAIDKAYWRRGLASEAAGAVLEYGFRELRLDKIVAVAVPENAGSRRVMEKLGMRCDYIGRFYERDLVHYTITREEFLGAKTRRREDARIF